MGSHSEKLYMVWYLLALGVYFVLLAEMYLNKTYGFLSNVVPASQVVSMIEQIKSRPPYVKFSIQNYHY